ncbi:Zinc/cadmium resistance protein [Chlorella vulgaris]
MDHPAPQDLSSPLLPDRESRGMRAQAAVASPALASPRTGGSFSYPMSTFPRNMSMCQLAGGASDEETLAHKRIQRKLIAALCLAFVFMIVEVVGGIYAHSLAIITDAAHLLSDVSGFAVAVLAAFWAKRKSQEHFSYGYHRVEVLGALASVMTVWLVTGILLFEAVQRMINPEPVNGKVMFIIACLGVGVNLLMLAIFGHNHGPGASCSHSHGAQDHGSSDPAAHNHSHGGGGGCKDSDDLESGRSHSYDEHTHSHSPGHEHAAGHPCSHGNTHHGPSCSDGEGEREEALRLLDSGRTPILAAPPSSHLHGSSCGHDHSSGGGGHTHAHGPLDAAGGGGGAPAAAAGGHSHDHSNLNLRGAVIHVIGDFVQSIGVAIAGALIWWHQDDPAWYIADPVCTLLFALLVLWTTKAIMRDISDVLMERVPRGLCIKTINDDLSRVAGVEAIDDLHVWALTPGIPLMCAHVVLADGADPTTVLHALTQHCRSLGIEHSTIQLTTTSIPCEVC